jgi:hypothetical protein
MAAVPANAPVAESQDFIGVETIEFSGASPTASAHFALLNSANAVYSAGSNAWALNAPGGSVELKLTLPVLHGVAIILRLSGNASDSPVTVSVNGVNLVENFAPSTSGFANMSWYVPETLLTPGDNSIVVKVPGGTTPALLAAAYIMSFSMQAQLQDDWCWAAVASSVAGFFDDGKISWPQCMLVNELLKQTTCCTDGASIACNQPWYLSQALEKTRNIVCHHAGAQPIESIREQISAANPIGVLINWTGGGSHFVAVTGVGPDEPSGAGKTMIAVENSMPNYGFSYIAYESFPVAYGSSGVWAHSYCTQPRS